MASREITYVIDLIARPQFRRLVEFVDAVRRYADAECDTELRTLVEDLRDDLARMAT